MESANKSILFFDGNCSLCNRAIRFLIKRDRQKHLYFAPLQGSTAQTIVPLKYRQQLSTVVYNRAHAGKKHSLHVRSEAILLALLDIGGWWKVLSKCARLFPLSFRNWCYDRISNHRQHLYAKKICELPTKEEQMRILP